MSDMENLNHSIGPREKKINPLLDLAIYIFINYRDMQNAQIALVKAVWKWNSTAPASLFQCQNSKLGVQSSGIFSSKVSKISAYLIMPGLKYLVAITISITVQTLKDFLWLWPHSNKAFTVAVIELLKKFKPATYHSVLWLENH